MRRSAQEGPLDRVIARIVETMHPEQIWLLGSRAEARARPGSDYDLLAVMPDDTPASDLDPVKAYWMVMDLGVPVDILPCTRSEFEAEKSEIDTLARAAVARGAVVYDQASTD